MRKELTILSLWALQSGGKTPVLRSHSAALRQTQIHFVAGPSPDHYLSDCATEGGFVATNIQSIARMEDIMNLQRFAYVFILMLFSMSVGCSSSLSDDGEQSTDREGASGKFDTTVGGKKEESSEEAGKTPERSDESEPQFSNSFFKTVKCSETNVDETITLESGVTFDTPPTLAPEKLNIAKGDVVKWRGIRGGHAETVVLGGLTRKRSTQPDFPEHKVSGRQICVEFNNKGTYTYEASFDSGNMKATGTINVGENDSTNPNKESVRVVDCGEVTPAVSVQLEAAQTFDTPPVLEPKEVSASPGDVIEWTGTKGGTETAVTLTFSNHQGPEYFDDSAEGTEVCIEFNDTGTFSYEARVGSDQMWAEGTVDIETGGSDKSSNKKAAVVDCSNVDADKTVNVEQPLTFDTPASLEPKHLEIEAGQTLQWQISSSGEGLKIQSRDGEPDKAPLFESSGSEARFCVRFFAPDTYQYRARINQGNLWTDGSVEVLPR
jgi:plastocyanin